MNSVLGREGKSGSLVRPEEALVHGLRIITKLIPSGNKFRVIKESDGPA
jgi:hypothetical protein